MYSKTTISGPALGGGALGGAALPFTGLSFSLLWAVLAAFALLSAGGALLRVAPSVHARPQQARHARRRQTRVR